MFKCDECGREFSKQQGLTRHSKNCKPEEVEETEEVVSNEVEAKQESNSKPERGLVQENLSEDIQRQIKKLTDAKNSCYDAEAKYKFEQEIKRLKSL